MMTPATPPPIFPSDAPALATSSAFMAVNVAVDWDSMPRWATAVVQTGPGYAHAWMFATGGLLAINHDRLSGWECPDGMLCPIPPAYAPRWSGEWQASLIRRPDMAAR